MSTHEPNASSNLPSPNLETSLPPSKPVKQAPGLPKPVVLALDILVAGAFLWPLILVDQLGIAPETLTPFLWDDLLFMLPMHYAGIGISWAVIVAVGLRALLGRSLIAWLDKKALIVVPAFFIVPPVLDPFLPDLTLMFYL